MNPLCKICQAPLLRWSWWEHPDEEILYFYCLECDKAGRTPFIIVKERHEAKR